MSKRYIQMGLAACIILAALTLLVPAVRYPLMGWLRGEKFIDGYPVSYWLMKAEPLDADSEVILRLGQTGSEAVPVLLRHALDERRVQSLSRINAEKALILLGPQARSAIPQLIDVVVKHGKTPDYELPSAYSAAVNVLVALGPEAVEATPHLIPLLKFDHFRDDGAKILAAIGPGAKEALPALKEALKQKWGDPDRKCHALASIGAGEDVIPEMLDGFQRARFTASLASALIKMHRNGLPVIPHAIKALDSKDYQVRHGAAYVLKELGPEARDAVPTLEKLTKDDNENVRYLAKEALKKIKPANQ